MFEKVEPRYTSQKCSACGHRQKMPLAIRVYECGECRIVIGRDHNAAINLDRAGQARISTPVEKRISVCGEAGTCSQFSIGTQIGVEIECAPRSRRQIHGFYSTDSVHKILNDIQKHGG